MGKTNIAAAMALELAHYGHETLVVSTDPAHSLGDVFEAHITNTPTPLAPYLASQEITVAAMAGGWGRNCLDLKSLHC